MTNQDQFRGRDVYRFNYKDEPGKLVINPEPGLRGYRLPKEIFPDVADPAWPGMNRAQVLKYLEANFYVNPRQLEDGSWVALFPLATTWSICTDITRESPYAYRWCFTDLSEAEYFLATIKEFDEIPTRRDSLRGHRFEGGFARMLQYGKDGFRKW